MTYERIERDGFVFRFTLEPGQQDMHHIFARSLATPEDVFAVFFDESLPPDADVWDDEHQRWKTTGRKHVLTWYVQDDDSIQILSCMNKEETA